MITSKNNLGFTLIEVLVAVLVLAIGLLGLAHLEITSLKNTQSAYFRTQASIYADDMFERMRANQAAAISGGYKLSSDDDPPAKSSQANIDLNEWLTNLANTLPNGDGSIACTDSDTVDGNDCSEGSIYTIIVSWTESKEDDLKGKSEFTYEGIL